MTSAAPPLAGIRVVEIASLGPVPFAGMMLADLGADVIRVDRPAGTAVGNWRDDLADHRGDLMGRGKRSIRIDLKHPRGQDLLHRLLEQADVLTEGLRPGAMEKLGLGPDEILRRHPRLIYGRVSGWGRSGPLASLAGHDINYLGLSGVLAAMGAPDRPPEVPLNLLADFGGGGAFAALGICAALVERDRSGLGQVVDHSMLGGTAVLSTMLHGMIAVGKWATRRHDNELDGGAPYYRTYRTADDRFVAVGAIEPQFYQAFLTGLELEPADWPQHDRDRWPELHRVCVARFGLKSRAEWEEVFASVDACVTPVLGLDEAPSRSELREAGVFVDHAGIAQPGVFPEFSRSPGRIAGTAPSPGQDTSAILSEVGLDGEDAGLRDMGVIG